MPAKRTTWALEDLPRQVASIGVIRNSAWKKLLVWLACLTWNHKFKHQVVNFLLDFLRANELTLVFHNADRHHMGAISLCFRSGSKPNRHSCLTSRKKRKTLLFRLILNQFVSFRRKRSIQDHPTIKHTCETKSKRKMLLTWNSLCKSIKSQKI